MPDGAPLDSMPTDADVAAHSQRAPADPGTGLDGALVARLASAIERLEQAIQPRPAMLTAKECAGLIGTSTSHWWRLDAAGKNPKPIKQGGATRWSRAEVEKWIALGCLSREHFQASLSKIRNSPPGSDRRQS